MWLIDLADALCFRSIIEDPEKLELEVDFYMPKVISTGKFKGEGRIGQIPVMGKGVFNVTSCECLRH